jgi:hypothetical protein
MSTILKLECLDSYDTSFSWNTMIQQLTGEKINIIPVEYIDCADKSICVEEMFNIIIKYVKDSIYPVSVSDEKDYYVANNCTDIYYNKKDGYWITIEEDSKNNKIVVLYKKTTRTGYIYNSCIVKKIFSLMAMECNIVVPNLVPKSSSSSSSSSSSHTSGPRKNAFQILNNDEFLDPLIEELKKKISSRKLIEGNK